MHFLEALQHAGGFIAHGPTHGKNVVMFALRRARNVQQKVFNWSSPSLQAAILVVNLCVLYGGAFPLAPPPRARPPRPTRVQLGLKPYLLFNPRK